MSLAWAFSAIPRHFRHTLSPISLIKSFPICTLMDTSNQASKSPIHNVPMVQTTETAPSSLSSVVATPVVGRGPEINAEITAAPADLNMKKRRRSPSPMSSSQPANTSNTKKKTLRIAVIGCVHGELENMYRSVDEVQERTSQTIDLIVCCGDFQAVRNQDDLQTLACPAKYRSMGSFWLYYSGKRKVTVPTIFVGGNHEASNHLQELPLGGLVAPNIYFLGYCGVIRFKGLTIGGLSGVYVHHGYEKNRFELPPYSVSRNAIKSIYHTRKIDVDRLLKCQKHMDVFVSHDWPRGITKYGNENQLLRYKSFLRTEINNDTFGNPGSMQLLKKLKPTYWFAAHMHTKFPAVVTHEADAEVAPEASSEAATETEIAPKQTKAAENKTKQTTKFLSLDKIIPGRDFLQILDIPLSTEQNDIEEDDRKEDLIHLDLEWLTILRKEAQNEQFESVTADEITETERLLKEKSVPTQVSMESDFEKRVEPHDGRARYGQMPQSLQFEPRNLQLMSALGMEPPLDKEVRNDANGRYFNGLS